MPSSSDNTLDGVEFPPESTQAFAVMRQTSDGAYQYWTCGFNYHWDQSLAAATLFADPSVAQGQIDYLKAIRKYKRDTFHIIVVVATVEVEE